MGDPNTILIFHAISAASNRKKDKFIKSKLASVASFFADVYSEEETDKDSESDAYFYVQVPIEMLARLFVQIQIQLKVKLQCYKVTVSKIDDTSSQERVPCHELQRRFDP